MLVLFKLMYVFGLTGIMFQLLFQIGQFLTRNFQQVLSPAQQAQLQIEKIFIVFLTPFFWIAVGLSIIGFLGAKKYKNNLKY